MYTSIEELPPQVLNSLDRHDSGLWMEAYNTAVSEGASVREAKKKAWHRVEREPSSFSVYSVATAENIDKAQDKLTMESVAGLMDTLIDRGGNMQDFHGNYTVATIWDWERVTVNDTYPGIAVWYNLFGGGEVYDQTRRDFLDGKNSLSVGGRSIDPERECSEEGCYIRRTMHDLMEISLCRDPDNPLARMLWYNDRVQEDIAKSSGGEGRLTVTSTVIHKDYTVCPVQALKRTLRESGYDDVHARYDGVYIGAPSETCSDDLRKSGYHVVPQGDGVLVNTFDRMLEADYKDCLGKGYIRRDGSFTRYIPEDRFKDLYRKGLCTGDGGMYRMLHPNGGISVK